MMKKTIRSVFLCLILCPLTMGFQGRHTCPIGVQGFFFENASNDQVKTGGGADPIASFQSQQGRLRFTEEGVFFGVILDVPSRTELSSLIPEKRSGLTPDRGLGSTVVLNLGFANQKGERIKKRVKVSKPLAYKLNIIKGAREAKQMDIPVYGHLEYSEVWEGISVGFNHANGELKLEIHTEAGSNLNDLVFHTGAESVQVTEGGELVVQFHGAHFRLGAPAAHLTDNRDRVEIGYKVLPRGQFGLDMREGNLTQSLIIQASLVWGTYLGGQGGEAHAATGAERVGRVALDGSGNIYVVGSTPSADYPTTPGVYDSSWNGCDDVVVTKFDPSGVNLLYSTYIGGTREDKGVGVAVNDLGEAFVVGTTYSDDFPTSVNVFDPSYNGGYDVFICKLNATGTSLVYSTYLGSSRAHDEAMAIDIDDNGNAYVTGITRTENEFPTTPGAFMTSSDFWLDAFVTKLNPDGSALVFSTLLGGIEEDDRPSDIKVDQSGNVFVTGSTKSPNFPTSANSFDPSYNQGLDVFLTKLDPTGSFLVFSTFIGGTRGESGRRIGFDPVGNIILGGSTSSDDFPITPGVFASSLNGSNSDCFLAKFSPTGQHLLFSTYFGGRSSEGVDDLIVELDGNILIAGRTSSIDLPVSSGSFNGANNGETDVFVSRFSSDGTALLESTYLGGQKYDSCSGIAQAQNGAVVGIGVTTSNDLPVTPTAPFQEKSGRSDLFLFQLSAALDQLDYLTYFGGSGEDTGSAITVDSQGHCVVVGETASNSFPVTPGVFDTTVNGDADIFVTKLDKITSQPIFSTLIGGLGDDRPEGVFTDMDDNIFIVGQTSSQDFPVSSAAYDAELDGTTDAFILKLDAPGTNLGFSTYLGGQNWDMASDIAVTEDGTVYVVGNTQSYDFPVPFFTYSNYYSGNTDIFVASLDHQGSSIISATFLGSDGRDFAEGIGVDASQNVHIVGLSSSSDYPTTMGAFDTSMGGSTEGIMTTFSQDLSNVTFSTFLGGDGDETVKDLVIDSEGYFYVFGYTSSSDFPTTPGAFSQTLIGRIDMYVTKIAPTGTSLVFSTLIGGSYDDYGQALSLGSDGRVYVVGNSKSPDWPVTPDALISEIPQNEAGVFFVLDPMGGSLNYSTFFGGNSLDSLQDVVVAPSDFIFVVGTAYSPNLPVMGGFDLDQNGHGDAIVMRFDFCQSPELLNQPQDIQACPGDSVVFQAEGDGSRPLTYQWKRNGLEIDGAVESTLFLNDLIEEDFGSYSVEIANGCGAVTSNTVELASYVPVIDSQPIDQVVCEGQSVQFQVQIELDASATYQWHKNGVPIIGATQPTLSFHGVTHSDAGTYHAEICNDCGCTSSNAVVLDTDGPYGRIMPSGAAQGIEPLIFEADIQCSEEPTIIEWENVNTGEWFFTPILTLPVVQETTRIRLYLTDTSNQTTSFETTILCHQFLTLDLNGDGCNDLQDLWMICSSWRQNASQDPSGDGKIDLRDLLYINTDGQPCP